MSRSRTTFFRVNQLTITESQHSQALGVSGEEKNCPLEGRNLDTDPGSRWEAICPDQLGLERLVTALVNIFDNNLENI